MRCALRRCICYATNAGQNLTPAQILNNPRGALPRVQPSSRCLIDRFGTTRAFRAAHVVPSPAVSIAKTYEVLSLHLIMKTLLESMDILLG